MSHEKTNNVVSEWVNTNWQVQSYRRWLEAGNFGFRKYRNCTICVAKTKALRKKLISAFVFTT